MATGRMIELSWLRSALGRSLEVKSTIIGPNADQERSITILNRTVTWSEEGIKWEADPRHAEAIVEALGLQMASGVAAPCTEEIKQLGDRDFFAPLLLDVVLDLLG